MVVRGVVCRRCFHCVDMVARCFASCECPESGRIGSAFKPKHLFPILDASLPVLLRRGHGGGVELMEARQDDVRMNVSPKNTKQSINKAISGFKAQICMTWSQVAYKRNPTRCRCCSSERHTLIRAAAVGFRECSPPKAITTPHLQSVNQSCCSVDRRHLLASLAHLRTVEL